MSLTVAANELRGSEIQTLDGYSYGYYETSMKVAPTSGVVNSFFVIAEGYDSGTIEIDVEILTNESWINSPDSGLHPSNEQRIVDLDFNPTLGFHRYGFLWEPGKISYTIDGEIVAVNNDPKSNIGTDTAYIMMNAWTGNPSWGGGPPKQNATSYYDFVKFYDGVTEVITTVRGTGGNDGLAGGTNTDVFEASTGNDVFRNFTPGVDYIDFSKFGALRASDVSASLVGGNLRLAFNGNTITIEGVNRLAAGETSLGAAFESSGTPEQTNHAPVANPDTGFTTNANTAVTISIAALLANDSDSDGDSLTLTGVGSPSHGTVQLSGNNVVFTPQAGYTGAAGFSCTISDGHGATASSTVGLTVNPAAPTNTAPAFASGTVFSLNENTKAVGTVTASDADGDALTFAKSGGADAALFNIDSKTGAISFVNAPGYEKPGDANGDNVYLLGVSVTDGKHTPVPQNLQISVKDVADTTPPPAAPTSSFFAPSARPAHTETSDRTDYELGMKFRALKAGDITGLRYYRGTDDARDTDTRTLHLWTSGERNSPRSRSRPPRVRADGRRRRFHRRCR